MRDDLHKGAPVPSPYRRLLKAAMGGEPPPFVAHESVIHELRELTPGFLRQLVLAFGSPQVPFLVSALASISEAGVSPLDQRVAEHLARCLASDASVAEAFAQAIHERLTSRIYALDGYLALKEPRARFALLRRTRGALDGVDVRGYCAALLRGEPVKASRRKKPAFDVDEDLR